MKEFWDERYSSEEYIYGTEPNEFFRQELDKLNSARILLPAEGEGRNGVYAAQQGWEVVAFDFSAEARKKALKLAEAKGVELDFRITSIEEFEDKDGQSFDAIGLFFVHLPVTNILESFSRLFEMLKPGGVVIFEAFTKEQLQYNTGGPKDASMLYSEEDMKDLFRDYEVITWNKGKRMLDEGELHAGEAVTIQVAARKRV